MRLVKIVAPEGRGAEVAQLALDVGISHAGVYQQYAHGPNKRKDVVDVETSTPLAKAFVDALLAAPFFDPQEYSLSVRQPRTIVSRDDVSKLTWPIVEPATDVLQELWQFSHVTFSFAGRILIAAALLAYGMIQHHTLTMIGGLLFMPFLPVVLSVAFGLRTREWRLAGQGAVALAVAIALTVLGGALVALVTPPPLRFNEFNPLPISLLISLAVGVASGLASADDVGRRELIGLAAAAQVALIPVWAGISLVFGFAPQEMAQRLLTFALNLVAITGTAAGVYALLGLRAGVVRRFTTRDATK